MKVFISHKEQDKLVALRIQQRLAQRHQIDTYLDVIDKALTRSGEDLADYLRTQMASCTHLLAVTSAATRLSSWVPWEVGVATERAMPLATYSDGTRPMEFLERWPYLMTDTDLDQYAIACRSSEAIYEERARVGITRSAARSDSVREFYKRLRASLGQ